MRLRDGTAPAVAGLATAIAPDVALDRRPGRALAHSEAAPRKAVRR